MTFYDDMAQTAQEMINEFGRDITRHRPGGSYDPGTDINTDSGIDFSVKAVFTEFKQSEIDGTIIVRGDKKALISSVTAPVMNDLLIDGAEQYRIVNVETIKPGDTEILYKAQVRK